LVAVQVTCLWYAYLTDSAFSITAVPACCSGVDALIIIMRSQGNRVRLLHRIEGMQAKWAGGSMSWMRVSCVRPVTDPSGV
jgi:hypothetical protein